MVFQDVHNQEIEKFRGETIDTQKYLRFLDGGGDLVVELKDVPQGWRTGITTKVRAYSTPTSKRSQRLIAFLDYIGPEGSVPLRLCSKQINLSLLNAQNHNIENIS